MKPIQYKKGFCEFYKLKFLVNPDVLIPRSETELLVDVVLQSNSETVLDIGTGAGNIAISIAKNCSAKIIATDVSQKALMVARKNARLHGVENRIKFIKSDLLEQVETSSTQAMIIVTNLPYIPSSRIHYLDSSVKDYEPYVALDGGEDGFELYRKLFFQINQKNLKPKLIIGEIDYTHGELAQRETQKFFPKASVEVKTDLNHKQRILIIDLGSRPN